MDRWYCKYRHEDLLPGEPCNFPLAIKMKQQYVYFTEHMVLPLKKETMI